MTIDDLDRIRGKNERRREELESRLAEQCRHRDAMEDRPVRKIAALVLLVSLSFFESAIAAETEEANEPWNPMEMVALWPIRIDVEISPDGKKAGLTETMLYEAVELALRQNSNPRDFGVSGKSDPNPECVVERVANEVWPI